jgi:predicted ATPase
MRIKTISVSYFKSLTHFTIVLAKFSCLIGLNGVGKSTVLQFGDFLGQLVRGDIKGWLDERHWSPREIHSSLSTHKNIGFAVILVSAEEQWQGSWTASFNTTKLQCTEEIIETQGVVLRVQGGRLRIADHSRGTDSPSAPISFSYEGSVLSQLREEILPPPLVEFKRFFSGLNSFDLLSPENLRQRTREAGDSIGRGGKRLSSFVHGLGSSGREQLTARLKKAYPKLETLGTKTLRSGWKQLEIQESFRDRKLLTEARHINDGMLRLIAILAELQDERHDFLLFDEIENGINAELVEFLLDALVSAPQQVMVTTHSPVILNYLNDEVARAGVIYLYKTDQGHTRAIPFFSIPSLAEKLKFMGPGEAFVDTELSALADEIAQIPGSPDDAFPVQRGRAE